MSLSYKPLLLALFSYLFLSTADALSRLLMQHGYSQQQVIAGVVFGALLPVLAFITYERGWKNLRPQHPGLTALIALIGIGEVGTAFYAFRTLTYMVESYAIFFTAPLWVALLSALWLKERLTLLQGLAILLGFAGVLLANWPSTGTSPLSVGHLAALAAAVLAALRILILRKVGQSGNGHSLLLSLFVALLLFNVATMPEFTPVTLPALGLLALGALAQGGAHILLLVAARKTPAPLLAPFQFSQALWGAAYGALLFAEWPKPATLGGLMLVVLGGILLVRSRKVI